MVDSTRDCRTTSTTSTNGREARSPSPPLPLPLFFLISSIAAAAQHSTTHTTAPQKQQAPPSFFVGNANVFGLRAAQKHKPQRNENWLDPKKVFPLLSSFFPPNRNSNRTMAPSTTTTTPNNKRKAEDQITKEDADKVKEDVVEVAEEVAAAAAATDTPMAGDADAEDKDDDDGPDSASKRRFFPRVKHLLTPEWEPFLIGVLDALDEAGAPESPSASHKESNPWYKAFNIIYNGVAHDCSVPHGKNRYHKFKDKILELWQGVEAHAPEDFPLRERALNQYEDYRKACATYAATPKKEVGTPKTPSATPRAPKTPASIRRILAANKWKHLDEAAALAGLPEPLKSLVNIRHMVNELGTNNADAAKEEYEKALQDYLKDVPEDKDALYAKSLGLVFLCRYSQSATETKEITEVYERVISDFLVAISDSSTPV